MGTVLGSRYEVQSALDRGGFGITYKARDQSTDEIVAIKEYFPEFAARRCDDGSVAARDGQEDIFAKYQQAFRDEAEALSGFDHPNIVEVRGRFEERGTSYFVMAFIAGDSLERVIRENGPLPTEAVMLIAEKVISAVQQIHAQNRLHKTKQKENGHTPTQTGHR